MHIPKLKRIKVSTEQELRNWLARNTEHAGDVMIVTCNKTSPRKQVSREEVGAALRQNGWNVGQSYTLIGNLTGHVASRT